MAYMMDHNGLRIHINLVDHSVVTNSKTILVFRPTKLVTLSGKWFVGELLYSGNNSENDLAIVLAKLSFCGALPSDLIGAHLFSAWF